MELTLAQNRAAVLEREFSRIAADNELMLLRALLRASDVGVLLSDTSRVDLICNPAFCRLFNLDGIESLHAGSDYLRAHLASRVKDVDAFFQSIEQTYADPYKTFEDEIEMIGPRKRRIRRFTAPVTDDSGRLVGRLWTFLDITRLRRLEERVRKQARQLREQARQLSIALRTVSGRLNKMEDVLTSTQRQLLESEKMSAVGLLAASVAHDIRNILTPLNIELTLAREANDSDRAESFDAMAEQIEKLSILTGKLLAIARPPKSDPLAIDLGELVRQVADLIKPHASMEKVQVQVKVSPKAPKVAGEPAEIEQVLVNLALNGIQAMHKTGGGKLTLTVAGRDGGAIARIDDTGEGIEPSLRRHLFDPFFTTRPDGIGLGLYACQRIVTDHRGDIRVRSARGRVTSFTVWLPEASS